MAIRLAQTDALEPSWTSRNDSCDLKFQSQRELSMMNTAATIDKGKMQIDQAKTATHVGP
jgi:hypothetical protein